MPLGSTARQKPNNGGNIAIKALRIIGEHMIHRDGTES